MRPLLLVVPLIFCGCYLSHERETCADDLLVVSGDGNVLPCFREETGVVCPLYYGCDLQLGVDRVFANECNPFEGITIYWEDTPVTFRDDGCIESVVSGEMFRDHGVDSAGTPDYSIDPFVIVVSGAF